MRTISRFVVGQQDLPPPDVLDAAWPRGRRWLITDDGAGLSSSIARRLLDRDQEVVLLRFPGAAEPSDSLPRVTVPELSDEALRSTIGQITEAHGPIGGFVHVHPARPADPAPDVFEESDPERVRATFFLAKHLQPALAKAAERGGAHFAVVTRLDGELGLGEAGDFAAIPGGLPGLAKTLNQEWPGVRCRAIDVDPAMEPDEAADAVLDELRDPDGGLAEVGCSRARGRTTLTHVRHDEANALGENAPKSESVFLVSGGGRGITARCAVAMARAFRCRFVLLGRSSIEGEEPAWANGIEEERALKKGILDGLQSQGQAVTPKEVERAYGRIVRRREVRATLRAIEEAGGQATYAEVDVTHPEALREGIERASGDWGPVTGIVHGVGNLADKKIEQKTERDFAVVFEPKVLGLKHLLDLVDPDRLDHLALFSSVSGYFGNPGQADYALANEVLNKAAHALQRRHPHCHVVAMNWGPWDAGMVGPELKRAYAERGVDLIPVEEGTRLMVEELGRGPGAAQVLFAGAMSPGHGRRVRGG